jgi:hypothetical protein
MAGQSSLLIPEIIDCIARNTNDVATLKNLALTCKYVNAIVESTLWRTIVISIQHADEEWSELPKGRTFPIQTLQNEKMYLHYPEWFLENDIDKPLVCTRSELVRHISFRKPKFFDDRDIFAEGFSDHWILRLFKTNKIMFTQLRSVRIDGAATQDVWDALLHLPMLRELRIWRTIRSQTPPLNFSNLSKLRSLELGYLSAQEGILLGTALLESSLERLHFSFTSDLSDTTNAVLGFLSAISAGLATSNNAATDKVDYKRLPPLVELGIATDEFK